MKWVNLEIRTLRSPAYMGSSPAERATWLNVLAFCCEQENGGRIQGAKAWKDRQWQQVCGVTLREVERAGKLLFWENAELVIAFYPIEQQSTVVAKRELARVNGARGGRPKAHREEPTPEPTSVSKNNQHPKAERKGKEEEGNNTPLPPSAPASPPLGEGRKKDALPTTPEALAIAALFGRRPATAWHDKEVRAFKAIVARGVMTEEAMLRIAAYYAVERSLGEEGRHRRDLKTFLNNFDGELDRANAFRAKTPERVPSSFRQPMNKPPERPAHAQ